MISSTFYLSPKLQKTLWDHEKMHFQITISKAFYNRLIDCMVFNNIFISISVILRQPVCTPVHALNHYFLSKLLAAFSHSHCRNNGQTRMNPVAMTIINSRTHYWPSRYRTSNLLFSCPVGYRLNYGGSAFYKRVLKKFYSR